MDGWSREARTFHVVAYTGNSVFHAGTGFRRVLARFVLDLFRKSGDTIRPVLEAPEETPYAEWNFSVYFR